MTLRKKGSTVDGGMLTYIYMSGASQARLRKAKMMGTRRYQDGLSRDDERGMEVTSCVAFENRTGRAARLSTRKVKLPFVSDLVVEQVGKDHGMGGERRASLVWCTLGRTRRTDNNLQNKIGRRRLERYICGAAACHGVEEHCVVEKPECLGYDNGHHERKQTKTQLGASRSWCGGVGNYYGYMERTRHYLNFEKQ